MTADPRNPPRALGKGLAALLGESAAPAVQDAGEGMLRTLPIAHIVPHPLQPRQRFDEAEIASLAASIREKGIVQPLMVRPAGDGENYQIVAGERRWRAAQRIGLHEVPVVVRRVSDSESLEIALVENLQRRDLGPLEEAAAYRRLIREFDHRQEDVAAALGKSRSHVANTIRLLELPAPVRELIGAGTLSAGHGRALLAARDPAACARDVVRRGLTVRQTEELARRKETRRVRRTGPAALSVDLKALQEAIRRATGLETAIQPRGEGGRITIAYRTPEQLEALAARLRAPAGPPP